MLITQTSKNSVYQIAGRIFLLLAFLCFFRAYSFAQSVGISADGSKPDASAMLDIKSGSKGLLIPRVSLTSVSDATTVPSPQVSLLVFNKNTAGSGAAAVTPGFYFWNGTAWNPLTANVPNGNVGNGWTLTGNGGTASTNFIGTTDDKPLNFRVNNQSVGRLSTNGNVFFGLVSGASNTTGFSNVAMGIGALNKNKTTSNIVAIGDSALFNNGSNNTENFHGIRNTAIGSKAATSNTTGFENTAVGAESLFGNISGRANTSVGFESMHNNSVGSFNSAVGSGALFSNKGDKNTAVGNEALNGNIDGVDNVGIGFSAMNSNVTGRQNTAVGAFSNVANDNLVNATAIGANALVGCSNCMVLGAVPGITGEAVNVGIGVVSPPFPLTFPTGSGDKISLSGFQASHFGIGVQTGLLQIHTGNATGSIAFGFGSSAVFTENMRITGKGNVGIGTSNPTERLHVVGNIVATGTITSFSDIRYKTDIEPLANVLETISKIQPFYYQWNKNNFPEIGFPDARQIGFAAQELEKYYPEIVLTDDKGYKSVDYGRLTPVLLQAIKEQQFQINELMTFKNELLALKKQVLVLQQCNP